jgi:basic membrane protein A
MPEPRPLRIGEPSRLGEYRVLGSLGEGGQGSVYLAESAAGQRVAIKVLHPHHALRADAQRRFLREVAAARQVATFSTARVIDVNMAGDRPYIVSEYVDGVSLEERVRERGPLTEDELVRLALGTAGALAAIHRAGIVHRDFKPSNVLLGPDGPRVIDFGIARVLDSLTASTSGIAGTPGYMAPEQIADERLGPPADVFSWAATMIFAATGRPAFGGGSVPAVLHAILSGRPDLTGVPPALRPVLERCLARSPEARPTAEDLMLDLVGRGAEDRSPPAPTENRPRPAPTENRPRPAGAEDRSLRATAETAVSGRNAPPSRKAARLLVPVVSVLVAAAVAGAVWLRVSATGSSATRAPLPAAAAKGLDKVGVAFDVGGRGDLWFNDSAAAGLDRAKGELGVRDLKELSARENETETQKQDRLRALARGGYNPVIAIGYPYSAAVKAVAAEFPRVRFAIVDSVDATGANVSNLVFAEQEGGFLAGAAAALLSKKGHVGFVGAVEDSSDIQRAATGFTAGTRAVTPGITVDIRYVSRPPDLSGYNDPAKAEVLAAGMFDAGADVLFEAAGGSNSGVMRAAKLARGHVIGAEEDEALTADDSLRGVVATSIVKRVDHAVFAFLKSVAGGTVKPGPTVYGLRQHGIGYTTTGGQINGVKARLDELEQRISTREIIVPTS